MKRSVQNIVKYIKYYGKNLLKIVLLLMISILIILAIICKKYKVVYKVTLDGETLGYVENKDNMQEMIETYENNVEGNIAFINIPNMPEYELEFVSNLEDTDEEKVLSAVEDSAEVTCRVYAIQLDGETKAEVNSEEEAESIVQEIKNEITSDLELNLAIVEEYKNQEELEGSIKTSEVAKATINEDVTKKVTEYENSKITSRSLTSSRKSSGTTQSSTTTTATTNSKVNSGLFVKPVSGTITSKYGYRSSGFHTGLDIATSSGTPIHAAAAGTVTYAGWKGSYGNLVIIDHGNGYQTYYAHCSAIYVSVGEYVTTDTAISAVGSTGNSTGPHLHLEIRINGSTVNPQNYLY